jgi:hypothetical protein
MRWFILRALGLWFISLTITSAVVLGVRSDPESPTLKAVGLSLCGDAPCFRGLKVGSSWEEVEKRFPESKLYSGYRESTYRELPMNIDGVDKAFFSRSEDGKTVQHITLNHDERMLFPQTQITAGGIVARYGAPCLVLIWQVSPDSGPAILIYPELQVYVDTRILNLRTGSSEYHLLPTTPVMETWVSQSGSLGLTCDSPMGEYMGHWHGFISSDLYVSRFRTNSVN